MAVSFAGAIWQASRPKTLTAAAAPVIVGTALAYHDAHVFRPVVTLLILLSAAFIQIGTNFVNDALDFIKGADTGTRIGPARATAMGWLSPKKVLALGGFCFLLSVLCGIPLVVIGGWPIFWIGIVSVAMGYCYTGGPFPLAYVGLGDLFVLIFFGWVAVGGTYFLSTGTWTSSAFVAGTHVGLLGTLLIAINNLRDRSQDALIGKKTFAVRLGRFSRFEPIALILVCYGLLFYWLQTSSYVVALLPVVTLPFALWLNRDVWRTEPGPLYNFYLARAAKIQLGFAALMAIALVAS